MPSFATGREIAGLKGLLGRGTAVGTGIGLFQQGQSNNLLDQALRSIPNTSKTDAGRALGNFLMNEASYRGKQLQNEVNYMGKQLQKGITPYANTGTPYANTGIYGRYIPGSDQVSINQTRYLPPEERDYQQKVSSTAQLTAQDPELQRYEDARIKAEAQGATPERVKTAEDIGMQIWAKKYGGPGGLASKVKPGQAGYDVIQNTINPGAAPRGLSAYGKAGTAYDYRDYGEPQNPTVGYQMQSPITSVPGLNATTAQQVNTGAQVQAQDLADLFKNAVFDEELMKQIQQYN